MKELIFNIYDTKLLVTRDGKNAYTVWAKIAQTNNDSLLDYEKLEESRDFRDFDQCIYYLIDEDEELFEGLELDEGTYVVEYEYLANKKYKLDDEGNVISGELDFTIKETENV